MDAQVASQGTDGAARLETTMLTSVLQQPTSRPQPPSQLLVTEIENPFPGKTPFFAVGQSLAEELSASQHGPEIHDDTPVGQTWEGTKNEIVIKLDGVALMLPGMPLNGVFSPFLEAPREHIVVTCQHPYSEIKIIGANQYMQPGLVKEVRLWWEALMEV